MRSGQEFSCVDVMCCGFAQASSSFHTFLSGSAHIVERALGMYVCISNLLCRIQAVLFFTAALACVFGAFNIALLI